MALFGLSNYTSSPVSLFSGNQPSYTNIMNSGDRQHREAAQWNTYVAENYKPKQDAYDAEVAANPDKLFLTTNPMPYDLAYNSYDYTEEGLTKYFADKAALVSDAVNNAAFNKYSLGGGGGNPFDPDMGASGWADSIRKDYADVQKIMEEAQARGIDAGFLNEQVQQLAPAYDQSLKGYLANVKEGYYDQSWIDGFGSRVLGVALPAAFAVGAGLVTGGAAAPVLGAMGGAAAGGAAAGVAGSATTHGSNIGDIVKAGGIGAITGAATGGLTPMVSGGIQSAAPALSTQAANTIAGGVVGAGTSAATQAIATGSVNPIGVGTAGLLGGFRGYNQPLAPSPVTASNGLGDGTAGAIGSAYNPGNYSLLDGNLQTADLNTGLIPTSGLGDGTAGLAGSGDGYTYDLRGDSLSLANNNSGLQVDPSIFAGFSPSYDTNIGYSAGSPELTLMDGMSLNLGGEPSTRIDYSKAIKPLFSGLMAGLLPPMALPEAYSPVMAPNFTKLNTKQNSQGELGLQSQSLFPWQSIRLSGNSASDTDYLNDYRNERFKTPETMGLLAQPKPTGNALRDLQGIANKQVLPQTEPKKEEPKYLEEFDNNYLSDWKKSNKDNLTQGIWQAYA